MFQLSETDDDLAIIWAVSGQNCNLHNGYKTCSQHGAGHTDCCIDIFGYENSKCSAVWGMNLGGRKDNVTTWKGTQRDCVQPNKMVYNDGDGTREISLPNGTLQEAMDWYKKKNYTALAGHHALRQSEDTLLEKTLEVLKQVRLGYIIKMVSI
ncbi:hypothetical protein VMCG_06748 [Cytospora schulzeri]|uniref:Uncharacterized protein n=1 Tax=Cytospora schulzeri TaxID=448051 RepID=A0A423W5X8_9PEZI|nr:hypothetical protein VMCG_06748 [Valsa malicola]